LDYICFGIVDQVGKRESAGIPLISLTLPHYFACPKPDLYFRHSWFILLILAACTKFLIENLKSKGQ